MTDGQDMRDRDRAADSTDASGRSARSASGRARSGRVGEKLIAGVPARIMRPRIVFICCLSAILAFGLLMVYSASAVEALQENGSSTHYLIRQALLMGLGLVMTVLLALGTPFDLKAFMSKVTGFMWASIFILLLVVLALGAASGGAVRWIDLGFTALQPSEFAKPVIILVAARIMTEYYEEESIDTQTFLLTLAAAVLLPALLIFIQPDMGTTIIIVSTVCVMLFFSGVSYRLVFFVFGFAIAAGAVAVIAAPYRLARFAAASDPWSDPFGTGYQATLAIMAFASGGLFGRGIGNSTMKYNYLPEAHNDYILAIIGEEVGFVGTILFFAVFLMMLYAGSLIAKRSPTLQGRLIAYGSTFILCAQFFINALGILGVTPMTGKTMPFISYGGSSIISCLILAGLILRVSVESGRATVYDARRADFSVVGRRPASRSGRVEGSTAGEPRPRSRSDSTPTRRSTARSGFSVYEGGPSREGRPSRNRPRPTTRRPPASGRYERVNLNDDPSDRLRPNGSTPRVNRDASRDRRDDRRRGSGPGMDGRGRYGR
ncbi:MAG: putative peptidoglycan glycosyltransferase FtsW [Collinsella sp.]|nr:putative peptidoglycan glycosyltransferase FtsW [Collinsella sp.]